MDNKKLLTKGYVFALVPAILFLPSIALFAVCPPSYGPAVLGVIFLSFSLAEYRAIKTFANGLATPGHATKIMSSVGMVLAGVVFTGTVLGLLAAVNEMTRGN